MRLQYPPQVRILRVPCTGRVDVVHVLEALLNGADGVFLSGCLLGDCRYTEGNRRAAKRVSRIKEILGQIGIEPERVEIYFNSAGMGAEFAKTCRDFTERIRGLGPLRRAESGASAS
jgi:F420-non-reducing hydrogenase iron-sulfur subunit